MHDRQKLTIASNRLPVSLTCDSSGSIEARRSSGGLVSAMEPVLSDHGGSWIGWSGICGVPKDRLDERLRAMSDGYTMDPVPLSAGEREAYYLGYANRVLWPLLHGLEHRVEHDRLEDRATYLSVNRRFADALARDRGRDPIWIHDYHLLLTGAELRARGCARPLGFFLHTPFPPASTLRRVPGHATLLAALTAHDSIGFQTATDRDHFLEACDEAGITHAASSRGTLADRAGVHPISVDAVTWSRRAATASVSARVDELRRQFRHRFMLLGVDRLDYTKGLPAKIRGFSRLLERHPALVGQATLVQLTIPSREEIPAYADHRRDFERLVADVNRRFGTEEWTPIEHVHGSWEMEELTARYRAADALLVTSVADGMNLVAKEFCASQTDGRGALVLSRHAGAAQELGGDALIVDPADPDSVADATWLALTLDETERRARMRSLRRTVRKLDLDRWATGLLESIDPGQETSRQPDPRRLPWRFERPGGRRRVEAGAGR